MGKIVQLYDSLRNAMTGTGTARDSRSFSTYAAMRPLGQDEVVNAYSGSGLMRKIIQIPALDMVREWRDWKLEPDQIGFVEKEEARLGIRRKVKEAEVLRGLGGGALILGLPGELNELATKSGKCALAFVHVVSRWHLSFDRLEDDARLSGYGEPVMWRMNSGSGTQDIHPSRVVPFRADTAAMSAMRAQGDQEAFWGESMVKQVLDAVQDSDTARASFAALIHKARLLRIGIPNLMGMVASGQSDQVFERLAILTTAESIHNATVFDAGDGEGKGGEEIKDATYNFAGAKDVLNNYSEFACAVSDIPATRLLGRAPDGMNSSGESQQKDWNKKIRGRQELELAPCLDKLDEHLIPSALGSAPDTAWYEWAPLDVPTEKENAETFKLYMDGLDKLVASSTVPDEALAKGVQSRLTADGYFPALEQALAEIPEEERFGITPDLEGGDLADLLPSDISDAAPRTLYVSRPVLNRAELQKWATTQGLGELQAELHVTIAFSRTPVDWMKAEEDWSNGDNGNMIVNAGGPRLVEPLGDRTAVLLFSNSHLGYRHERIKSIGASWDWPDYQAHISLTGEAVDLVGVEPYQGKIELGPERFEEIDEGFE